ncbi:BnaCnng64590D [Brassica napus]|uniref:BnaCnng64590D protein n=2 Tax=Brassica TaxID=3705 RepID=A0A078JPZ2_BRANA|nr:BnaCnng64590D [Brassica napus]
MELKRMAMCIKSSLSSIIPKNLQAGYNMANPQLLLSELAGRYKKTRPVSSSVLGKQLMSNQYFKLTTSPSLLDSSNIPP